MTTPKSGLQAEYHKGFWTPEKNPTKLCGTITINAAAAAVKDGKDFTVAYDGAGLFTISTTETHFTECLSALVCVESAANNQDIHGQIAAIVCVGGAATAIQLRTTTAAVETDPTNNDDVHFEFNLLSLGQDVA